MTAIQLYDTAARKKRDFVPQDSSRVTMYVCGPTVYSTAHIGNFRPAITFDVLYRLLRHEYGAEHVIYARNITDVDDKINAAAAAEGVDISVITDRFAKIYREDSAALNILAPNEEPAATAHMADMIALMEQLVDGGFAYKAEGHVLFDVTAYEQYGALSRRSLDDMIAGARVEVAPYKRNPADFVLWKPSKPGEPSWGSPFGPGRPGWHTECSAMIKATFEAETIDIHGGGADLVFPHHENEIAQSACAHGGAPLANYWLHNGFLSIDAEKMSKSLGNIVKPRELMMRGIQGEVIRYAMLTGHYRAPLDWNDQLIERAQKSLDRLYGVLRRFGSEAHAGDAPEPVLKALRDDMNTPKALAALFEIAGRANKADTDAERAQAASELKAAGDLLGLLQVAPLSWFGLNWLSAAQINAIDDLLDTRQSAKTSKDFQTADVIRTALENGWVQVQDTPEGAVASYRVDYHEAYYTLEASIRRHFSGYRDFLTSVPRAQGGEQIFDAVLDYGDRYVIFDSNPFISRGVAHRFLDNRVDELKEINSAIEEYYEVIYGGVFDEEEIKQNLKEVSDHRVKGVVLLSKDGNLRIVERT